ncbi:MAG: hypothetical protein WC996_10015, partial [Peptostreptococcales bacterium]
MKSLLAKLTLKEISKHIAFLLVSTMLIVSILPANPSLAKYVLEPIQYFVSLTSAEIFGTTAITSIGPISGTTAAGNTLTAGLVNPEGATVDYQWKKATTADGVYLPIEGATSSSYVLQINDNNYYIKVTATGTGEYGGTVSSGYTGPVIATTTPLTAIGEITGTGLTGQTLT